MAEQEVRQHQFSRWAFDTAPTTDSTLHATVMDLTKVKPSDLGRVLELVLTGRQIVSATHTLQKTTRVQMGVGVVVVGWLAGTLTLSLVIAALLGRMQDVSGLIPFVGIPCGWVAMSTWRKQAEPETPKPVQLVSSGAAEEVIQLQEAITDQQRDRAYLELLKQVRHLHRRSSQLKPAIAHSTWGRLCRLAYNAQANIALYVRADRQDLRDAPEFRFEAEQAIQLLSDGVEAALTEMVATKQREVEVTRREDEVIRRMALERKALEAPQVARKLAEAQATGLAAVSSEPDVVARPTDEPGEWRLYKAK